MIDKNVEEVRETLKSRMETGLKKYGVTTEREDLTTLQWLQHAQEEALDLSVYLQRLKNDMDGLPFDQVRKFLIACDQTTDTDNEKQRDLYSELIKEEKEEFDEARDNNNAVEELDACCDMIWVIVGYALSRGWDIKGAFNEVARSNMSKIDKTTGKVLKREDGKVLKPETFSPPNLSKFI